jgi:probable HAF family extracellular repeat protein
MNLLLSLGLVASLLSASLTLCAEEVRYRVTVIPDLPGSALGATPSSVNDSGHVTGIGFTPNREGRAILWSETEGTLDLGALPGTRASSSGKGVNNHGHVAGVSGSAEGQQAFVWTPETGMVGLGDLPGGTFSSVANDINDVMEVVGRSHGEDGTRAFIWDPDNGMRSLGVLPGGRTSSGWGINNHSQVTGWSESSRSLGEAFIWDAEGGMRWLPELPGGGYPWMGTDINDNGQIVGLAGTGFLWGPEDGYYIFGIFPGPQPAWTEAYGVNDHMQAVGLAWNGYFPDPEIRRAFIWDPVNGLRELNALLEARTPPGYDYVANAYDINNAGQIVGLAPGPLLNGQGVLLTPFVVGDMNCDGVVDAFDIEPFVTGLIDPSAYAARWPDCFADSAGDINQDGQFDAFDIEPFVQMLSGP